MTPEQIGTLVGAAALALGSLIAAVVSLRKQAADARKQAADSDLALATYRDNAKAATDAADAARIAAESERAAQRDASLIAGMERLVTTLQGALDRTLGRAEHADTKHSECLELVGELKGRVEDQEVRLNSAEVALKHCEDQHKITASDAKALRSRLVEVEQKQKSGSDPAIEGAKR